MTPKYSTKKLILKNRTKQILQIESQNENDHNLKVLNNDKISLISINYLIKHKRKLNIRFCILIV